MIKKAMVLAAGFGKRLHPLTVNCPKPLLKIGNETLLSNTLKFLKSSGIEDVVINVHYLENQITDYIKKNKFDLNINLVSEKEKILDTGGGVLNAIKYFSNQSFLIINPDTIWNSSYLNELKKMQESINKNEKNKCCILIVKKQKSFDKSFAGDFSLNNNLITRENKKNLDYIYTGLQIIKSDVFQEFSEQVFSMNKIWDKLIEEGSLLGVESNNIFFHVSTLNIYKDLLKKLNIN
tara:strand:- start:2805 stop:3512 length:708 start_codon:yes stop_codon:yes gene_type:complete